MFVICRDAHSPWGKGEWQNALTRWEGKWYYATSLAKPTIFNDAVDAQIVIEGEVKGQYPGDEITVHSIDIFQETVPLKPAPVQPIMDANWNWGNDDVPF